MVQNSGANADKIENEVSEENRKANTTCTPLVFERKMNHQKKSCLKREKEIFNKDSREGICSRVSASCTASFSIKCREASWSFGTGAQMVNCMPRCRQQNRCRATGLGILAQSPECRPLLGCVIAARSWIRDFAGAQYIVSLSYVLCFYHS